ncbi:MAG TPA: serine/threonine-protein kinase, partial [Chroococcales cyanobacterium]
MTNGKRVGEESNQPPLERQESHSSTSFAKNTDFQTREPKIKLKPSSSSDLASLPPHNQTEPAINNPTCGTQATETSTIFDTISSSRSTSNLPSTSWSIENIELKEKIGEGAMGTVFRARKTDIDAEFAIKILKPQWQSDPAALKRFKNEAAAAIDLTHPNIAQIFGRASDEQTHYLLMEYVDGISLDQLLQHERCIEPTRLINIMLQVCDALEYAHLRGIVHRDLKPSNIIIKEISQGADL